ncbi:hypothetical protein ABT095_28000 [Kitasatospora sp. NPDC002227]|uniref:TolB family protein n=1 Tax=Kitasatospora sp. NPDC002227 TaxID=3154773 RepID=UPI003325528B
MSARARRRSAAIAFTVAVTSGAALMLTACDPSAAPAGSSSANAAAGSAPQSAAPAAPAAARPSAAAPATPTTRPAADTTPARQAPKPELPTGAALGGLTISDGSRYVVVNGGRVDFGTEVRDLAWSPDGHRAAFVNGAGDLVVSRPDGSDKVVVAKHPAGETWSHPAWQVAAASPQGYFRAKDNLFFVAAKGGVTRLEKVAATGGTPEPLRLGTYSDDNVQPNPETGNLWPSGAGGQGSAVYANSGTGEVFVRDENLRQQGGPVTKGSEPALSPDGHEIVFVRSVDGHDHLFALDSVTYPLPAARDLTPHATTDYTEPAWSADGRTIAARTPDGIVTLPAHGSAAPVLVSTDHGLPAYRNQG